MTLVAMSGMVAPALVAAQELAKEGVSVELVDPRCVVPLDEDAILRSVCKTGRLVIVDEARDMCSAASHISAIAADKAFESLKAPIRRVTVPDVAIPYAPVLEKHILPNKDTIAEAVRAVVNYRKQ